MKLASVQLSVRGWILLIVVAAVLLAGLRRAVWGDGGVSIELSNGLVRPIRDIRVGCKAGSIVADKLAPGEVMRGRLWPAEFRTGGRLDGRFQVAFTLDGIACRGEMSHSFDLLYEEPNVRWNIIRAEEPMAFRVSSAGDPLMSPVKHFVRLLWFRGTLPGALH
jgi:hypothetical protein